MVRLPNHRIEPSEIPVKENRREGKLQRYQVKEEGSGAGAGCVLPGQWTDSAPAGGVDRTSPPGQTRSSAAAQLWGLTDTELDEIRKALKLLS
jgi:hypothetical protein